jgi:hypothetical protein
MANQKTNKLNPSSLVSWFILVSAAITVNVYLFVTAPAPLPESPVIGSGGTIAIDRVFSLLNAENAVARRLYTQEIVGGGMGAGMNFSEDWKREDIEAGPLPALFLRETANHLERQPLGLGLFLGSDFPIKSSNLFQGAQAQAFARMREHKGAEFFFAADIARNSAMFPDLAQAKPCVACHNAHPQTTKSDWKLGDTMGATTWTHSKAELTLTEAYALIDHLRDALAHSYSLVLTEARSWKSPPSIGDCWPRMGYCLPSESIFMKAVLQETSEETLAGLFETNG